MRYIIVASLLMLITALMINCSQPSTPNKGSGTILKTNVPDSLRKLADSFLTTIISAQVEDPDGLDDIESVYFYSRSPDGQITQNNNPLYMYDDGSNEDEVAHDGIYTRKIEFSSSAPLGVYEFTFYMRDKAKHLAPSVVDSLKIYQVFEHPNKGPGTILETRMPDSLQIPATSKTALIEAVVEDPDGLNDVASVYFYSRKPDGSLANGGNPFYMVDDGTQGDKQAGDGTYSMTIMITSSAQAGTYLFTFYMRDNAGNLSDSKTDSIKVYQ